MVVNGLLHAFPGGLCINCLAIQLSFGRRVCKVRSYDLVIYYQLFGISHIDNRFSLSPICHPFSISRTKSSFQAAFSLQKDLSRNGIAPAISLLSKFHSDVRFVYRFEDSEVVCDVQDVEMQGDGVDE